MKKLYSFNDYMVEQLLEKVSNDELPLHLSKNLLKLLERIEHPISGKLIKEDFNNENNYKATLVDLDDSGLDMVSFMTSNKAIDRIKQDVLNMDPTDDNVNLQDIKNYIANTRSSFDLKGRSKIKIGRLVNKLFPNEFKQSGEPGGDIETFVNMFKAYRDTSKFEIVKGKDIPYWYSNNKYAPGGGSLNNSCMRYESCEPYLDFYVQNEDKVSLLILKDVENDEKIRGRAIVWELDFPSGRTFMDRIYTVNDSDVILFKEYAKEKGWIYKTYQDMDEGTLLKDTKDDSDVYHVYISDLIDPGNGGYPYMDTMKYFDGDTISNSIDYVEKDDVMKLESTDGEYERVGEYSEYYGEYIDTDDMVWCEWGDDWRYDYDCYYSDYYEVYIANDYAENNLIECDYYEGYGDDHYRKDNDCVEIYRTGDYATREYAENNLYYNEYENVWMDEGNYSDYHNTYLYPPDSVKVWTDERQSDHDYRDESDGTWWEWDYDGEKYSDDVTEEELREYHDLDEEDED